MSWSRYHIFQFYSKPLSDSSLDNVNPIMWISSRSDQFGQILEDILLYLNDFEDLYFLHQNKYLDWDHFEENTIVFDQQQQRHVIQEIQRFFSQLCVVDVHLLKKKICWSLDDFGNHENMQLWIDNAYQNSQTYDDHAYGVENFYNMLEALHLIIKVFQQALAQNLYVIYKTIAE